MDLDVPIPDTDDSSSQSSEYSSESLNRLEYLRSYDPSVLLIFNGGSFSLKEGTYGGSSHLPLPDEHYIPHTKLGRSIEYLKDSQLMTNEIYYLHNILVGKIREIIQDIKKENGDSETVVKKLRELIDRRSNPSIKIEGIGVAELTQIDGQFVVRVVSEKTDTVFYILNEAVISEDSFHLKKVQARQHFVAGANRSDDQRGRDVIFLWIDGSHNTKTTVSPRIEKSPSKFQILVPFYKDPQQFQLAKKIHRQLHRQDYWNAIRNPITLTDLSFGLSKALFQALLMGGIGLAQEYLTDRDANFLTTMTMAAILTLPCFAASSYRYWLNMGQMGFIQKRKDHVTIDIRNSIDWKGTITSKAARASISSIILAYGFLASTYWNDFQNSDSWWTTFYLFSIINAVAIPNILLNAVARASWAEQAFVNELAGETRGRMKFTNWSRKNFDYLWIRYFFYDITRLFHLAGLGRLPSAITQRFNSLGVNLDDLGVNFGLFSLIGSHLIGEFVWLRKTLNFQQRGLLEDRQIWDYLNRTHSNKGKMLLYIELMYRKTLISWHERYISKQNEEDIKNTLLFSDQYEESHLDLLDLTEKEKQHLKKWRMHQQVQFSAEHELTLYNVRQEINHTLAVLEKEFFEETSLEMIVSYRQRVKLFFKNFLEAIHDTLHFEQEPTSTVWQNFSHIVAEFKKNISKEEHVVMGSSYKQQVRISLNNLVKVIHGLFETLKAYHLSVASDSNDNNISHSKNVYLPFWKRYESPEQEDWFRFLEEHVTEDLPNLKNSLFLMTDEISLLDIERMPEDMGLLLKDMLKEAGILLRNNRKVLQSHVDDQEIENLLRDFGSGENLDELINGLLDSQEKKYKTHNYDLERFFQKKRGLSHLENRAYNYNLGRFFEDKDQECADALRRRYIPFPRDCDIS